MALIISFLPIIFNNEIPAKFDAMQTSRANSIYFALFKLQSIFGVEIIFVFRTHLKHSA